MRWITFAASGLGAIGLFEGTAGAVPNVVLEPLDWTSAGLGPDPVNIQYGTGSILLPAAGKISLNQDGFEFEADVVSRITGNRWEYGLENVVFSADSSVGA